MLLEIREKAQGWFAWLIVAFITIPFALWGIQSYLGVGKAPVAATVNGTDIPMQELDRTTRQLRERLRTQLGSAYRPEMFSDKELRKQALEQLINDAVLRDTAHDWQLRVSDEVVRQYIQSIPYFQNNGHFDVKAYRAALRNQGLSERSFEESVRMDLVMAQLRGGVVASALATDREIDDLIRLRDQQRTVAWVVVDGRRLLGDWQPDDKTLEDYYQEHKSRWTIPERVKVEYLLLDPETVGDQVEVTEEGLQAYWQEHQDEFKAPEERQVRHILISVPKDADQAAQAQALEKAKKIREQLKNGADFAELAKQYSQDPGSREQGGDLGWITRGIMVKPFEEAAFKLAKGEISEPVRTQYGYHIIQVTGINAGGKGTLDSLRDKVEAAYRRNQAENLIFDKAEKLADLAYENPDDLTTAAEALGLKIQTSDWFDRKGGKGPLASPKVVGAAFSEDVLNQGQNSELIELGEDRVLVLRVVDHEAERIPPLKEVKDKVVEALKADRAAAKAREKGEALLAKLRAGETNLPALAQAEGLTLNGPRELGRHAVGAPLKVVEKAFQLPRPAKDKPAVGGVELPNGDYALLAVAEVRDGDPTKLDEKARQRERQLLARTKGVAQFNLMGRWLRQHSEVEIPEAK